MFPPKLVNLRKVLPLLFILDAVFLFAHCPWMGSSNAMAFPNPRTFSLHPIFHFCLNAIPAWILHSFLECNRSKAELFIFPLPQLCLFPLPSSIPWTISPSTWLRRLKCLAWSLSPVLCAPYSILLPNCVTFQLHKYVPSSLHPQQKAPCSSFDITHRLLFELLQTSPFLSSSPLWIHPVKHSAAKIMYFSRPSTNITCLPKLASRLLPVSAQTPPTDI